jgi:hypothetical protein
MTASDLAREMGTSRASIHRAMRRLMEIGLVRFRPRPRSTVYRVDPSSPLARPLYELFNHERYLTVAPRTRNTLERIMAGIDKRGLRSVVLFGSQATGLASKGSDIDLCFVWAGDSWDEGFQKRVRDLAFPYILIEPHCYTEEAFLGVPDLVALDATLFGISLLGHDFLFNLRHGLQSVRKAVLLARLDRCRETLDRASKLVGEAKGLFEGMVEVGLAEIESVLKEGVTVPKSRVRPRGRLMERISVIEDALSKEGELIWVT